MNEKDRKDLARHLKILDTTPNEISVQRQAYRDTLAAIDAEERKGIWGKVTLDKRRQEAKEAADRTCHALAHRMRESLEYVKAHNNYADTETIDFESPKLQSALRTIDYMGKDLSPSDQMSILHSFAGDIGALRVIEKAFAKNGLYMKSAAKELQKPISAQAINEMSEVLAYHDYHERKGEWSFPIEKATWTKGEFGKQLQRLSIDATEEPDAYSAVLDAAADQIRADRDAAIFSDMDETQKALEKAKYEAQLYKLQHAQKEMKEAQARGDNPATVLNRELAKLETAPASGATE